MLKTCKLKLFTTPLSLAISYSSLIGFRNFFLDIINCSHGVASIAEVSRLLTGLCLDVEHFHQLDYELKHNNMVELS